MNNEVLTIGDVERDSGIARDTLRIWERRYGFPQPVRNTKGERIYTGEQLRRLQRIRRLLDQGLRPGKVVALPDAELDALESEIYPEIQLNDSLEEILRVLQTSDATELEAVLYDLYQQQGMQIFITETVMPLLYIVGERWARGGLQIFEEHLLSVILTRLLSNEISVLQKKVSGPRILLATLPGEQHALGLLMLAALLSTRNLSVINLGSQVPIDQIVSAVSRFDADVLGLSFSGAYPYESIRGSVSQLREMVSEHVAIWLGGEGVKGMRSLPHGVTRFHSFNKLPV